jgi:hypothetical protein
MRRMSVWTAIPALMLALAGGVASQVRPAGEPGEARRIREALALIERSARPAGPMRQAEFSDNDLNVYIRHRLRQSREDILRDARVQIYAGNRIEGWFDLDFSAHKIPAFIKPRINLYFMGAIFVKDGSIRFEFKDIFLEKEKVPLLMLDMIVFAASQLGKTDATSVSQWHRLPPGIRDIRTADGRFTLYY